jgi:hypothetical protein
VQLTLKAPGEEDGSRRARAGFERRVSRREADRVSATRRVFSGPHGFVLASAALAWLLTSAPAHAGNNGAAEELFRQGQALMQAGKAV